MTEMTSGAIVLGYAVIALFFLRFHRDTGDRLFAIFSAAFTLLAVQRLMLAGSLDPTDGHVWLYGLRLLAFLLILWAIIDKNRAAA